MIPLERAYLFGNEKSLLGILTEPLVSAPAEPLPTLLLLNAGLLHRVGPFRMHVDLARRLAKLGFPVFRLDLSGKGDSEPRRGQGLDEDRAIQDIQEAMDFLAAKKGHQKFILFGLCSGADNAHPVALRDPRVVGAVFLDGFGYATQGHRLRHYGRRLRDLPSVKRFLLRKLSRLLPGISVRAAAPYVLTYVREFPPCGQVERELKQMTDQGKKLLFVYTGGVETYFNDPCQFDEMFPRLKNGRTCIEVVHYPDAEHTYPRISDREKLLSRVTDWAVLNFSTAVRE
ncbi:MAG: alpha/beta fold hydrolase [Methylotenera sp.]|nr:alpha/beta fold hydrolase [Oligoflexia bacterium]